MTEARDTHSLASELKAEWTKPALQRLDAGSAEEGGEGNNDGAIFRS